MESSSFEVNGVGFNYKVFKLLHPRNVKSKIVLTGHNQTVTETTLETYIPEFASDFVENSTSSRGERNYIIHFYVQSKYLDDNVTTERDNFNFSEKKGNTSIYPVQRDEIECEIASLAMSLFGDEVRVRLNSKRKKIEKYVGENIWYKPYLNDLDYDMLKMDPSKDEMEEVLHKLKYKADLDIKRDIEKITSSSTTYQEAVASANGIIKKAKQANLSELAHYVAFRKAILDLLESTIRLTENGTYKDEHELHNIIFPTRSSSKEIPYDGHNLWVLDERLTFTQHIASDQKVFKAKNQDRPDIAAFHHIVSYRETNEKHSPISIFEFKKPGRHDFVNQSSKEDPFDQIKRYVQAIKNGEVKTIEGLQLLVGDNTPFYGYIVADSDKQVESWLKRENFKALPDGNGWFYNHDGLNLYVEYITWQKMINDAKIRHRRFFELLGAV